MSGSTYLLGTIQSQPAIVHLERTILPSENALKVIDSGLAELNVFLDNKPVYPLS
jgi:hypothetical protein